MQTDPPPHLSPQAQAAWLELYLDGRETLASLPMLEAMAVQLARARDAQRRIDEEGMVISSPKGEPIPHPAIAIERAAQSEVAKLAKLRPRPKA